MSKISIFSKNKLLIDTWTSSLSPFYQVNMINDIYGDLNADIVIIDSQEFEQNDALFLIFNTKPIHFLISGKNWSESYQIKALIHGASGYCNDTDPPTLLTEAVQKILNGDIWIPRHIIPKVIDKLIQMKSITIDNDDNLLYSVEDSKKLAFLSTRELDVAKMIKKGESNKAIAKTLLISERTVKAHLTSIFKKLNVPDRLHLAILMKESN